MHSCNKSVEINQVLIIYVVTNWELLSCDRDGFFTTKIMSRLKIYHVKYFIRYVKQKIRLHCVKIIVQCKFGVNVCTSCYGDCFQVYFKIRFQRGDSQTTKILKKVFMFMNLYNRVIKGAFTRCIKNMRLLHPE